jgi:hypothetical protein
VGIRVPTLEIQVVDGCNLRCTFCSHDSPGRALRAIVPEEFAEDLRRCALQPDVIKLIGGEPSLHPRLEELIDIAASCAKVEMSTNGLHWERWEPLLPKLSRVLVSSYPGFEWDGPSDEKIVWWPVTHFRRQFEQHDDPERVYATCRIAHEWKCLILWDRRIYRCAPSKVLDAAGVDPADSAGLEHLIGDMPAQCSGCLGTSGELVPHAQLPSRVPIR